MNKIDKILQNKVVFTTFVLIVFSLIFAFAKNAVTAGIYCSLFGVFTGFTYTNMYWKAKWDKVQKDIENFKKNYKG